MTHLLHLVVIFLSLHVLVLVSIVHAQYLPTTNSTLNSTVLSSRLNRGAGLLGTYQEPSSWFLSNWMSTFADETPVQNLSIAGTHDSLSCKFGLLYSPYLTKLMANITLLYSF
jgi:hypothetical protein